jgi:2-keto-4-pentenoate hydratase/2-oxohepta-3-ene-1,7-dioic acid hydratase in catechol pathway
MKIVRFLDGMGMTGYAAEQADGSYRRVQGGLREGFRATAERVSVKTLLAPVEPVAIWCVGQNYKLHAKEAGFKVPDFPVIFAKGINATQGPGLPIVLPAEDYSREVDYECELVVVIGKTCKNINRARALECVAGYMCGNDVSARDWQLKWGGSQWCRGKSFDTFAPIGPCLVTPETISDPLGLRIQTTLNGQVMQDASTRDMIFDVPTLIEFLSRSATLLPGTLIFTGTPHGVGMAQNPPRWLSDGDEVTITIDGIGSLTNPVQREKSEIVATA